MDGALFARLKNKHSIRDTQILYFAGEELKDVKNGPITDELKDGDGKSTPEGNRKILNSSAKVHCNLKCLLPCGSRLGWRRASLWGEFFVVLGKRTCKRPGEKSIKYSSDLSLKKNHLLCHCYSALRVCFMPWIGSNTFLEIYQLRTDPIPKVAGLLFVLVAEFVKFNSDEHL